MEFELSVALLNRLLAMIDRTSELASHLSGHGLTSGNIVVPSRLFDGESLKQLQELAKQDGERALLLQLVAFRNIEQDRESNRDKLVVDHLDMLAPALVSYFCRDLIDGWVYRYSRDGVMLPWLVTSVEYVEPQPLEGRPYVCISLLANTVQAANKSHADSPEEWRSGMTSAILFYGREMGNLTIPELLARKGFFKECPEFKREYESQLAHFQQFQLRFGQQFIARHSGFFNSENILRDKLELFRIREGMSAKCINDEEILQRRIETNSDRYFWRKVGVEDGFSKIPLHCYLFLFHLELHQNIWVHVQNLTEYQYKPDLRNKLILPPAHRTLVDILTSNMDVLMDDIVEGKSGGTTILCMGASGLGKTLTAEVYSEAVGKPLYRVHSGQLGISASSVEAALSSILRRAARWDSILLLDEADVYIRKRDNDMQHNAIVAEFLRTLEYFDGLLFMTTNRVDDVDDAILSRCIAVIRYEVPLQDDAVRLWQTLSAQFRVELSDQLVQDLVAEFPHSSGRDIKELLKLTSRFCNSTNVPFTLDAFRKCAVFRGKI
ncbi:MAG: ATP-binding protein [Burkholderiaceae bacterium]|nr:ATP-binding protein [Burkholderiaceae bacterium]